MNNILIHRVFEHRPDNAPSALRIKASSGVISQSEAHSSTSAKSTPGTPTLVDHSDIEENLSLSTDYSSSSISISPERVPPAEVDFLMGLKVASSGTEATQVPLNLRAGMTDDIESSGMLIDFDFMRWTVSQSHQTSVSTTALSCRTVLIYTLGNSPLHGNRVASTWRHVSTPIRP